MGRLRRPSSCEVMIPKAKATEGERIRTSRFQAGESQCPHRGQRVAISPPLTHTVLVIAFERTRLWSITRVRYGMGNVDQLKRISHSRHHIYRPTDLGTKAADRITGFVGSWPFVGIHAVWFIIWIALRPEPFPFGLLTLLVSLEAIFLSTFV